MPEAITTPLPPVAPDPERIPMPEVEDVLQAHVSPDVITGLGRSAVEDRIKQADYAMLYGADSGEVVYGKHFNKSASGARAELESLDWVERRRANKLLSTQPESRFVDERLGVHKLPLIPKRYVQKLIKKDRAGNYVVDNNTFGNFLEWHNHALVSRQSEFDNNIVGHKRAFASQINKAREDGWVPSSAVQNLNRLHRTDVYVDDGFNTELAGNWAHAIRASGKRWRHKVVEGPSYAGEGKHLTHEFIHILEGTIKNVHSPQSEDPVTGRYPAGLERMFGTQLGGQVINEALVEHLADSLLHGKLDSVNPASRARRKSEAYDQGRLLLYALTEKGKHKVDIRLFINALFENDWDAEELGEKSAQNQLKNALHSAFPFTDIVSEIKHFAPGEGGVNAADFADRLAKRSRRYKILPKKAAQLATRHLSPKSKAA